MSWFPRAKVVVPIDFSDASFDAVEVGLSLVKDSSDLHIVSVTPDVVSGDPGFAWNALEKSTRRDQILTAIKDRLGDSIPRAVEIHTLFGDAGREIARFAKDNGVELIVMPSHGRSGIKRLLIGSVAERVLRLAPCPVLVLRKRND